MIKNNISLSKFSKNISRFLNFSRNLVIFISFSRKNKPISSKNKRSQKLNGLEHAIVDHHMSQRIQKSYFVDPQDIKRYFEVSFYAQPLLINLMKFSHYCKFKKIILPSFLPKLQYYLLNSAIFL